MAKKAGLGVGLGLGVPLVIVAAFLVGTTMKRRRASRNEQPTVDASDDSPSHLVSPSSPDELLNDPSNIDKAAEKQENPPVYEASAERAPAELG